MQDINKFNEKKLKEKVKRMLLEAKKKKLIKSHVLAFENTPVKKEEHKGQLKAYMK